MDVWCTSPRFSPFYRGRRKNQETQTEKRVLKRWSSVWWLRVSNKWQATQNLSLSLSARHSRINSAVIFFLFFHLSPRSGRNHGARVRKDELLPISPTAAGSWCPSSLCVVGVSTLMWNTRNQLCCLLWKFVITFLYARNKSTPGRISWPC